MTTGFKLRRPCAKCPFRTDVPSYLRHGRAVEIATSLAEGAPFYCHETVDYDTDEEPDTSDSQVCAGSLIVMENQGNVNQYVRVAERLGLYEANKMDTSAPVHDSLIAFVDHHADDGEESETCSVVESGCLAPAGMLVNGMAVPVEPEGDVHSCESCGEPVCDNCSNEDGVCFNCAEADLQTGGSDGNGD